MEKLLTSLVVIDMKFYTLLSCRSCLYLLKEQMHIKDNA